MGTANRDTYAPAFFDQFTDNIFSEKSRAAITRLKRDLGQETDVSFIRIDLGDLASVRKAAAEILEEAQRIDALMCNGAIAQVPTQKLTVDGFESQLGVNHFGHFLLCGLLF